MTVHFIFWNSEVFEYLHRIKDLEVISIDNKYRRVLLNRFGPKYVEFHMLLKLVLKLMEPVELSRSGVETDKYYVVKLKVYIVQVFASTILSVSFLR